jgi:hypothetical protein
VRRCTVARERGGDVLAIEGSIRRRALRSASCDRAIDITTSGSEQSGIRTSQEVPTGREISPCNELQRPIGCAYEVVIRGASVMGSKPCRPRSIARFHGFERAIVSVHPSWYRSIRFLAPTPSNARFSRSFARSHFTIYFMDCPLP